MRTHLVVAVLVLALGVGKALLAQRIGERLLLAEELDAVRGGGERRLRRVADEHVLRGVFVCRVCQEGGGAVGGV